MPQTVATLMPHVALAGALLAVAVTDMRARRIPNVWVLFILLTGLVHAFVTGGFTALGHSALGIAAGAALLTWQYRKGLMGAGDLKLLAAVGAWTGPMGALWVMLIGSALGGVLSVIALARLSAAERVQVGHNVAMAVRMRGLAVPAPSAISKARGIPYGVSLSAAAFAVTAGRIFL